MINETNDSSPITLPITPGITGTITKNIQEVSAAIDSDESTTKNNIPDSINIINKKPTDEVHKTSHDNNGISYWETSNPNSGSESDNSESEQIEDALSISSSESDPTSSKSNDPPSPALKKKFDFNNSNSKLPELNSEEGLDIMSSEGINENTLSEPTRKGLRARKSAPATEESSTSVRPVRAKRSIRKEP